VVVSKLFGYFIAPVAIKAPHQTFRSLHTSALDAAIVLFKIPEKSGSVKRTILGARAQQPVDASIQAEQGIVPCGFNRCHGESVSVPHRVAVQAPFAIWGWFGLIWEFQNRENPIGDER
jgi:hypothetical protein